ncbi:MAG: calcium/sodium antiporter [Gammaproteobacteria bacterium]|nr:calcium/sodium antiporter [Gammaproteobacteria bacterium]
MSIGLLEISAVLGGFVLLVWGADKFVLGAAGTARSLGVAPLIIGLVVVGFGTSAPEMLVSGLAAYEGNPGLGVGNALGSNITNIGLVLGLTALFTPLTVHSETLKREFPVLFIVTALVFVLFYNGYFGFWDGVILLFGLLVFVIWMVRLAMTSRKSDPLAKEAEEELPEEIALPKAIFWLVAGLLILLLGARLVVWGAVEIAHAFGISDLVIGLTIVAIGTSLPELAASIIGARRGEHDLVIGNIIGSNLFNSLGVLGLPALLQPAVLDENVLFRDYSVMVALTIFLYFMARGLHGEFGKVTRVEGGVLVLVYTGYLAALYVMSV